MKLSRYSRSKIVDLLIQWLTHVQIIDSFPRIELTSRHIALASKNAIRLKYEEINWETYRYCWTCNDLKPHTLEYFWTDRTKWWVSWKCRKCIRQCTKNKRMLLTPEQKQERSKYNKQYLKDNPEVAEKMRINQRVENLAPEKLEKRKKQWAKSTKKIRAKKLQLKITNARNKNK